MATKKGVNGVINIPSSLKGSFFRHWLMFLAPFHHLTEREMDVATSFIKHRYLLSKVIKDEAVLDQVSMSEETKHKIREECNITAPHFQAVLSKLKKSKIIIDNKINPKFIPKNIEEGDNCFKLLLYFDLNEKNN